jgi:hypothetical protein
MKRRDFFKVAGAGAAAIGLGKVEAEAQEHTEPARHNMHNISIQIAGINPHESIRETFNKLYGKEATDQLLLGTPYRS